MLEFAGTALNIETAKLLLELKELPEHWRPVVGERVRLELQLPVGVENSAPRCISFRARVAAVTETPQGGWRLELAFRKPAFKDLGVEGLALRKETGNGWAM